MILKYFSFRTNTLRETVLVIIISDHRLTTADSEQLLQTLPIKCSLKFAKNDTGGLQFILIILVFLSLFSDYISIPLSLSSFASYLLFSSHPFLLPSPIPHCLSICLPSRTFLLISIPSLPHFFCNSHTKSNVVVLRVLLLIPILYCIVYGGFLFHISHLKRKNG